MTGRIASAAALAAVSGAVAAPALAQRATFQGIGHLPGGNQSAAQGVSGDGRIIVGSALTPEGLSAVRWAAATGLDALAPEPGWGGPGWRWGARRASDDGSVIVGSGETATRADVAFRWTAATGMVDLGALPGLTEARAWDVSADGSTVVGDSGNLQPFRWTETRGMEQFPPEAPIGIAFGISDDLSTIVGMSGARGFRWTDQGIDLFEIHVEPYAVSHDGSVFVGYDSSCPCAIRWVRGVGFVPIEMPPDAWEWGATDLSADGTVVVGWSYRGRYEAFIWDEVNGTRLLRDVLVDEYGLDLDGWELHPAGGIAADGTVIVGSGINPAGQEEGWVARLGNGPCYADCDASGEIDFFDFLCYQDAFAAAEPWADCDGSGQLDVFDFLCFQNAFAAGCP